MMLDQELADQQADDDDTKIQEEVEESTGQDSDDHSRFDISSYGWDADVEGLVKRMNRNDIFVPGFQRGFVWSGPEKSRFIESLVLGLPVPTLFFARDSDKDNRLNIIDGQQRLKTLQLYLNGEFALVGGDISTELKGCYHSSRTIELYERKAYPRAKILDPSDERTLSDAIVHSIVIRPNPNDDDEFGQEYNRAIIQVFKRLNTTGKALQAQEVRASIFHGRLLKLVRCLNKNSDWRALFGKTHSRMRDEEAILRALALYVSGQDYRSPMPKFLDDFMQEHRNMPPQDIERLKLRFSLAVRLARSGLGDNALKRKTTFVLAKFDALVVGLMESVRGERMLDSPEFEKQFLRKLGHRTIKKRMEELEKDSRGIDDRGNEVEGMNNDQRGYLWSVAKFTNETHRVRVRLTAAKEVFSVE